jgi:glycosyltransferase involved in cell wall biosynthesis
MEKSITAVFVTNIPVPYREKIHELVASDKKIDYTVLYCAKTEPNRQWIVDSANYKKLFLNQRSISFKGNRIYFGLDIIKKISAIRPKVIVLGSLSLTMLSALVWGKLTGSKCVFFSDSHIQHEKALSPIHKLLRVLCYRQGSAFIGPSDKTKQLFTLYTNSNISFFRSHLCTDNGKYFSRIRAFEDRDYDLLFSGQIRNIKMPFFFLDVVREMQKKRTIKVLVIGDGPDRDAFIQGLQGSGADVTYKGFLNQDDLPDNYTNAKLLLFPTKGDAWGIVANESLASGTPVITCEAAGVAGELVKSDYNGYVLTENAQEWAAQALNLLDNKLLWQRLSQAAIESVNEYTYVNAASGIASAIKYAACS